MNTAYLRTFIEVVNLQSFSKAAEKLFLTQPAVTKQVKILEGDFGIVLIKRRYNDIILTKEGKELYNYAVKILNTEDEIYGKFLKNELDFSGEITIFSSTLPANYLLDSILTDFSKIYNNICFNIKKVDSKKVYDNVISGNTCFGFTGMNINKSNIETIELTKDQLVLAVSPKTYKEIGFREISLDELVKQNFIIREKGSATFKTFEEALKSENYSIQDLKVKGIIEDNEIIKKLIIKGFGVSVISRLSIEKEINEGTIIPINIKGINLTRGIYYIHHNKRYFSIIENKFKEFIKNRYLNEGY